MFEIIGIIVVCVAVIYVLRYAITIVVGVGVKLKEKQTKHRSEYREAFMMEYSEEDLKKGDNKFASELDMAIVMLDAAEADIVKLCRRWNKKLENIQHSPYEY